MTLRDVHALVRNRMQDRQAQINSLADDVHEELSNYEPNFQEFRDAIHKFMTKVTETGTTHSKALTHTLHADAANRILFDRIKKLTLGSGETADLVKHTLPGDASYEENISQHVHD